MNNYINSRDVATAIVCGLAAKTSYFPLLTPLKAACLGFATMKAGDIFETVVRKATGRPAVGFLSKYIVLGAAGAGAVAGKFTSTSTAVTLLTLVFFTDSIVSCAAYIFWKRSRIGKDTPQQTSSKPIQPLKEFNTKEAWETKEQAKAEFISKQQLAYIIRMVKGDSINYYNNITVIIDLNRIMAIDLYKLKNNPKLSKLDFTILESNLNQAKEMLKKFIKNESSTITEIKNLFKEQVNDNARKVMAEVIELLDRKYDLNQMSVDGFQIKFNEDKPSELNPHYVKYLHRILNNDSDSLITILSGDIKPLNDMAEKAIEDKTIPLRTQLSFIKYRLLEA